MPPSIANATPSSAPAAISSVVAAVGEGTSEAFAAIPAAAEGTAEEEAASWDRGWPIGRFAMSVELLNAVGLGELLLANALPAVRDPGGVM
mmetsp:Transcript_14350/g.54124  ORF Transcript_14350/g.54124 Transcript_14350/m.54124 type:complete len:91 (+) Transcript_14350:2401-2673(+)